jgi:hypothetical protein
LVRIWIVFPILAQTVIPIPILIPVLTLPPILIPP